MANCPIAAVRKKCR